jgi:hypothetical protein
VTPGEEPWGTPSAWGVSWGSEGSQPQLVVAAGGSGGRYNADNLDLSKWARKKKRLNQRVQALQLKIQETRETLESETAEKAIATLRAKVRSLQVRIMELLLEMDELNKAKDEIETREVLTAYLAYRNLH